MRKPKTYTLVTVDSEGRLSMQCGDHDEICGMYDAAVRDNDIPIEKALVFEGVYQTVQRSMTIGEKKTRKPRTKPATVKPPKNGAKPAAATT